jgi:hypothetical protein
MNGTIDRPRYLEGQILAAADLEASQDHATNQLARHERALHDWGIAAGLALTGVARTAPPPGGQSYKDVTLGAGIAIDGTGREIVVPADLRLSEADFAQSNVSFGAAADAWFPVYLLGHDVQARSAAIGTYCGAASEGRTQESWIIEFGRPGDAATLDEQPLPAVGAGPGDQAWKVLVGFVRWDNTIGTGKFTDVAPVDDQGTAVRLAGIQADRISARGATMLLTIPAGTAGNGQWAFAVRDASGTPTTVLTIAANGDIVTKGRLQGGAGGGPAGVKVQSGAAWDGLVLPLPAGVTDDMVAPGKGILHVQLTPRIPEFPPLAPPNSVWVCAPIICKIDDKRKLSCNLKFIRTDVPATPPQTVSGFCDYLVVAEVLPTGSQS